MDKVVANAEIQSLTAAIGAGIGADFELDKVRYGKIIVLADADVDGGHIRTLLITFFYRQMTPLVEAGKLYVAQPPLYSVELGGEKVYVPDDAARLRVVDEHPKRQLQFARFKGLGEMDPHELRETCMDPATRHLVQLDVDQAVDRRRASVDPDGRRRRRPPHLDPAQRQRRPFPRHLRLRSADGSPEEPCESIDARRPDDAPRRRRDPDAHTGRGGRGRVPRVLDERHRRRVRSRTYETASSRCSVASCGRCTTPTCARTGRS